MKHRKYRHLKTGNVYIVKDIIPIKINNEWVDGVLYKQMDINDLWSIGSYYARTKDDFLKKFQLVIYPAESQ